MQNDRENDTMRENEGRQVQQELEDQLRAFGDTMSDAFAHGFEGRGMDIGDRAWDVGKAAVHAANFGIGEAARAFRKGRDAYRRNQRDPRQTYPGSDTDAGTAGMTGWFQQMFGRAETTPEVPGQRRCSAGGGHHLCGELWHCRHQLPGGGGGGNAAGSGCG